VSGDSRRTEAKTKTKSHVTPTPGFYNKNSHLLGLGAGLLAAAAGLKKKKKIKKKQKKTTRTENKTAAAEKNS